MQLFRRQKTAVLLPHYQWKFEVPVFRKSRCADAQCGCLQHGVIAGQAQHLLGKLLARKRPQTCTGAAAQNDG